MAIFLENPLPIAVIGALCAMMALMVFLARPTGASLGALVVVVAATLGLILLERMIVTDREQIEAAVDGVMAAIEANDVAGVLQYVDPNSPVVADIQTLMPLVEVKKARALGTIEVDMTPSANAPTAESTFQGFLQGIHSDTGVQVGYFNQRVDVAWVKQGERWLIYGYTAYYEDQPIDAVSSARSNRAVPGR